MKPLSLRVKIWRPLESRCGVGVGVIWQENEQQKGQPSASTGRNASIGGPFGVGVGAWPIGVSATITMGVAVLAYLKRADITITVADWVFFVAGMSSLPLWYFTTDPMWAVVLLTTVDVLGFGPTLRKAYADPHSHSVLFFSMFMVRNLLPVSGD